MQKRFIFKCKSWCRTKKSSLQTCVIARKVLITGRSAVRRKFVFLTSDMQKVADPGLVGHWSLFFSLFFEIEMLLLLWKFKILFVAIDYIKIIRESRALIG